MNQALAVLVNDNNLGFAAPPAGFGAPQQPKWQSILTAVGAAIPTVVGTYNATRQQPLPQSSPQPQQSIAAPLPVSSPQSEDDPHAVRTDVGFSLERGLNIGGIRIPILFLALGGVGLYLLFKEPPRRGR